MRLCYRPVMVVLVVLVVHMTMLMLKSLVIMLVIVSFRKMQPQADAHQKSGNRQLQRQGIADDSDGKQRPDERLLCVPYRDGAAPG